MAQYVPLYNFFEVKAMLYLKRIKELREDNDIKQQTMADYLSVSRSAYKNYENGERGIPTEILSKIADYYHTSTDFLIGRTDIKEPYQSPKKNGY